MATTTLGKDATFTLNGDVLTDFIDTVTFTGSADSLDVTTFGNASHRKRGGLFDGTIAIGGVYDTSATGPKDQVEPVVGTVVAFIWRPEGAGTGKPETTGNVLVQEYVESSPVADIVRWTASLERDGTWTVANQA
jgi:hypothetical protein